MFELLQLLHVAAVAASQDSEIQQLREKVNEITAANKSVATVDLVTGLLICACAIGCVGVVAYLFVKFDRRLKALERSMKTVVLKP